MQVGNVKREMDGIDIMDTDTNHRRPAYKEKQITSTRAVKVIDWVPRLLMGVIF